MPAYYDEVLGRACLSAVCKSSNEQVPNAPTPKPVDSDDSTLADYDRAKGVGSAMAWKVFVRMHPSGYYAELAKDELGKLARQENPNPNPPPDAGLPIQTKPADADKAARTGHDQSKDVGPTEHGSGSNDELANAEHEKSALPENSNPSQSVDAGLPPRPPPQQQLAHLENPKPSTPTDVAPSSHPKPPDASPSPAPQGSCALQFDASFDTAGVGHFVVKDSCGKLKVISIDYGNRTFTQASTSPNRAEFTFDFFNGPSALTIRATDPIHPTDTRSLQYQSPSFDQSGLAKAVIIWQGTTDLDLHAFENGAEPNSNGEVWRGNPRSLNDAFAYGVGFMSQLGQTAIPGAHVQVYTYRRSLSIRSVEFRVNQSECAPDRKRVKFEMLRYQNGQFSNPDGPVTQGALPRQCGAYAGNDKESWAPRARALDLTNQF